MTINHSMKLAVTRWVGETLKTLDRIDLLPDLQVLWSDRFTSKMGDARWRPLRQKHRVRFSAPLWPRATPKERRETVIHEVCHIVAFQLAFEKSRKIKPHGIEWQDLMLRCGIQPERTHSVSNEGLSKRKRVSISCGCPGKSISVTPYVAGRMAAGTSYRCRTCKTTLKPPPGTKPVERRKRSRKRRAA